MPHRLKTGRILVVDDQAANVRVVSSLLERHGYMVMTAVNGHDALRAAADATPDLILLDMMMPGMDGFELLAALHQEPHFRQIPAVFLTAAQDRDLLLRAFDAGAVDYVTKPFLPEELLARVNAHLGLKLTRDRLERVAREREHLLLEARGDGREVVARRLEVGGVDRHAGGLHAHARVGERERLVEQRTIDDGLEARP